MSLHDPLFSWAIRQPGKPALICGKHVLSYGVLARDAARFAERLISLGVTRGDRVAFWLPNSSELVTGMYGTWRAGGGVVAIGAVAPLERCLQQVHHSGARVVIAPAARLEALEAGLTKSGGSPALIAAESIESAPGEATSSRVVQGSDLAAIIYTSGSSGVPKGVTHTHGSIGTAVESIIEYLGNGPDDIILSVLQLNFSYGLLQLLCTIRTGGTLVLERGVGYPYELVAQFARHRVTGFAGSPTIWAMLLELKEVDPASFATVRYITNAAAAMPAPFVPRLATLFPHARIFLMHGMTECLRTAYLPPAEALTDPASIGRAMRGVDLDIMDEDGQRLGPGETGELVIGGGTLMAGYWDDPAATERVMKTGTRTGERWLCSGDLFRMDERGYFYFVARKDDVIKSRGEKVSPVEVEAVIYQLPQVRECRIIGIPDGLLGHRVRAEIVLREGQQLDALQVKGHCMKHLEPYKVPQEVVFVEALPKTEGGKILRK